MDYSKVDTECDKVRTCSKTGLFKVCPTSFEVLNDDAGGVCKYLQMLTPARLGMTRFLSGTLLFLPDMCHHDGGSWLSATLIATG